MAPTYHVDGALVPAEEATVSVRDRGFMYGDAAFETLRVYGGDPFAWEAHAERLRRTCERLDFAEALPPAADLRERVRETVDANDFEEAYARLSVTRGVQPGTLTPAPRVDPTVVVVVRELPRGGLAGEPVWDGPATLESVATRRAPESALPADLKTHSYLNGLLARLDLRRGAGPAATDEADVADEALLLDTDGHVTEGATSNVFFVADGRLRTPATSLPLLPGVTRSVVLDLAAAEGLPVETGRYRLRDLRGAEEVFLTNSTWEVRPVTRVDDATLPVGPITKLLGRLFEERVEETHY